MNEQKPVRPRGTDGARVVQVIETHSLKGLGTTEDPVRVLVQYWDFGGCLLAESDIDFTPTREREDKK